MRTINLGNVWDQVLESAVEVIPHEKTRTVYVDAALLEAVPAIACPTGKSDAKSKLNELYGHLRNHVAPYNEKDVDGNRVLTRVEVIAISNIDDVANGAAPVVIEIGGNPEGRRSRRRPNASNAAGVPTQQRQVTLEGKTYVLNT